MSKFSLPKKNIFILILTEKNNKTKEKKKNK